MEEATLQKHSKENVGAIILFWAALVPLISQWALCSCQETRQPSGRFDFYSDPTTTKHARLFVPSAT